jgi:hypothetical protein
MKNVDYEDYGPNFECSLYLPTGLYEIFFPAQIELALQDLYCTHLTVTGFRTSLSL